MTGRPSATLTIRIVTESAPAKRTSRIEKSRRPSWNAVCGWRSPSCVAILPNSARPPVWTTTPTPLPARTTVPMKAHDGSSSGDSGFVTGSTFFSAGADSPVRTDSSHSSPSASSRRRSAGTTSPTPTRTTSPGTSSVTSTTSAAPVPQRDDRVPELRVQRVDSARGAVLAHEPEPDTEPADQEDDDRVRPLAEERRRDRRSRGAGAGTGSAAGRRGRRSPPRRGCAARSARRARGVLALPSDERPSLLESRARSTSSAGIVAASARSTVRVGACCFVTVASGAVMRLRTEETAARRSSSRPPVARSSQRESPS